MGFHIVTGNVVNHQGAADFYLGILAMLGGHMADAERHFLEAERMHEAIGARPLLARTRAEYAMLCAAADRGWLDLEAAVVEVTHGIKRAGADLVVSYFAPQLLDWISP